jgi:DNA helicase-4
VESSCRVKNEIILSLIEPLFNEYNSQLQSLSEIDFNDMINIATDLIENGSYHHDYKFVIVDEYQDISKSRFMLLKKMREQSDFKLFCVGDDWQSIYRFAGSDIGFLLNYEKYWGSSEISKIETTYRFSKSLIEISGKFIMQNPMQIKKALLSSNTNEEFSIGEISGYTEKNAIDFMARKLPDLPVSSSVFFIGRYSLDVKLLETCPLFQSQYNNITGVVDASFVKRKDLKITFITAHKSKGLQADYVFLLNNKRNGMGFPSKIQDAPILNLLLDGCDRFPFAEERRLFYVAITRAKQKAWLITQNGNESEFVQEIKREYGHELQKEKFTCPLCGGHLIRRKGPYGEFWGCTNSQTGCQYKRKL